MWLSRHTLYTILVQYMQQYGHLSLSKDQLRYALLDLSEIIDFAMYKKRQHLPFISSLFIIFIGFSGLVFSLYPYIISPILSIKEPSSTDETLLFMLVGASVILPTILIYSGRNYYILKEKVIKTTHHY